MIYIINLKHRTDRKEKCIYQLKKINITNYKFTEAVNSKSPEYEALYKDTCKQFKQDFIKYNFSIGALGCFLSHIDCYKDAITNNYNKIIILEDDFLAINNIQVELIDLFNNIEQTNWDFIYLGKKQGLDTKEEYNILDKHIKYNKFKKIQKINDYVYTPSYTTWASHAYIIKQQLYQSFFNNRKYIYPIDLFFMNYYNNFKFISCYKDIFISDEESSDINENKLFIDWRWNTTDYYNYNRNEPVKIHNKELNIVSTVEAK